MALIPDQLRLMAEHYTGEVAYRVVGIGEMTFGEWEEGANRIAHALVDRGVDRQDRVALVLTPEEALVNLQAYMGVHKAGAATVPINVRLSSGEMRQVLKHAEPTALVASPAMADALLPVVREVASIRSVAWTGAASGTGESWEDFLSDDASDVQVGIAEDDIADILYTSGTTGLPKGVVVRHRNATQMPIGKPEDFAGLAYLHASPFFTFAGLSFVVIPPRLGFTGVYLPRFDAGTWLEVAEREPVAMAFLVPAMVELLLVHEDLPKRDLSSIVLVSVGSAPIAPGSLRALQQRVPNAAVSNSYSMSEAGAAYCIMPHGELERRPGSVGQPMPPLEIRIVDDDGNDLGPDGIGEILIRNPGKEREYFRAPEETAATWREGWLHSGDLGKLDADGYLYVVGRKKDVIIRGGNNVHAADVEAAIQEHPAVLEVAVIGIPHRVLGEDVAAFVVPRDGETLSPENVAAWCEERLADYKRPRQIRIVGPLPRNAMGKVLKRELAARLA